MASVLHSFTKDDTPRPKCFFSHNVLPSHIDLRQIPTARDPFAGINELRWAQNLSVVLPTEIADEVRANISQNQSLQYYAKVILSLSDLVQTEFLSHIKTHNVQILSEGRPGVDNRFELCDGVLRIDVDKPTYLRCGLVGQPYSAGGKKHKDNRYVIETNLRQPSMLHGKKGFERFAYAFKNVLNNSLVCLYAEPNNLSDKVDRDHAVSTTEIPTSPPKIDVLDKHHPLWILTTPSEENIHNVLTPAFLSSASHANDDELFTDGDLMSDIEEWISMIALGSPRVLASDAVDPYISRYEVPAVDDKSSIPCDLVHLSWRGFLPSMVLTHILLAIREARGAKWVAMQAGGFWGGAITVLLLPGKSECLVWKHGIDT